MNQDLKTMLIYLFWIGISALILYVFWTFKRIGRMNRRDNPFDQQPPPNDEYDPEHLEQIQKWNDENRPPARVGDFDFPTANNDQPIEFVPVIYGKPRPNPDSPVWFGDEIKTNIDRLLIDGLPPDAEHYCPPMPAHLEKMFDEQFTQKPTANVILPREVGEFDVDPDLAGKLRLLNAINQTPLEDAIEMLEVLRETIEGEAEFDKPAPEGKTPRDGHSAAWHGYFVLNNAINFLKGEPIIYIADVGGVYQPIFTREGENYLSSWEQTRRRWRVHSSEDLNPGFAEVHQDRDRRAVPCDHPFEWLCPGECGARIHTSGRNMPEHLETNGLCADCHICEMMNKPKLIEITSPPYFEDDQECGYCGRAIGSPHKSNCRQ